MNAEIFAALAQLEKERGIPQSYMVEKITQALVAAYKKDKDGYTDNVFVEVKDNDMHMYVQKEVVDDVITPATEITLDAARKISKTAQLGDLVNVDVQTKDFGRIAAQTAKQVIIQGIREAERGMVFDTFSSKEHEILTGTVLRIEPATNDMTIRIGGGNDKTDAMLSASEQVRTEYYHEGDLIRVYVVEVRRSTRGPQVIVSRTHPGLVKRLFELEVPEIASGLVEIKSIAREAGSRTKLAVYASQDGIDPVGACVGTRGARAYAQAAAVWRPAGRFAAAGAADSGCPAAVPGAGRSAAADAAHYSAADAADSGRPAGAAGSRSGYFARARQA